MSDEGEKSCPLCAEEMDLTDQQLKPCKCGYEICVWCWHHIMDMAEKDETDGRCPACRTPYSKEKIVGTAASCESLVSEMNVEKKKLHKGRSKTSEGRKQLANVRVIQRNLVYVVGLPLNFADEDLLQTKEYFGQYGKVLKVSISRTAAGVIQHFSNSTCSVYITYSEEEEAVHCIQLVHGFFLDGRPLRACFGTTKYCHAWLRNVPCSNPECLYLHEIGLQEDSFTKDETISAYTRVQQLAGSSNSTQRRSGIVLPPPADEYCNNIASSVMKPITRTAVNTNQNSAVNARVSPPNSCSGRSVLPAGASWGTRASNSQFLPGSTECSDESLKQKSDACSRQVACSTAAASLGHPSLRQSDTGKALVPNEESTISEDKNKPGIPEPVNKESRPERRISDFESSASVHSSASLVNRLSHGPPSSKLQPNSTNIVDCALTSNGLASDKNYSNTTDENIDNICSDILSLGVHENQTLENSTGQLNNKVVTSQRTVTYGNTSAELCISDIQPNSTSELPAQVRQVDLPETEDDLLSFENQRLKDPEVSTIRTPTVSHAPHFAKHSNYHSPQLANANGLVDLDRQFVKRNEILINPFSNVPSRYSETALKIPSVNDVEYSKFSPSNEKRSLFGGYNGKVVSVASGTGESSIISNILSMDFDSSNNSLSSSWNLAKLLGETDMRQGSIGVPGSLKFQNSNQSRFSFARGKEPMNRVSDYYEKGYNQHSSGLDFSNRNGLQLEMLVSHGGFPVTSEMGSDVIAGGHSHVSSSRFSGSRSSYVSTPPGFSVPNRVPPPGFSSHERMEQNFDAVSGNHIIDASLRNHYQTPFEGAHAIDNVDIEFIDPAILAVGKKGVLPGGTHGHGSGADLRSSSLQLGAYEDARFQSFLQRSLPPHQNQRFTEPRNSYPPTGDTFGILPSRSMDQMLTSNFSPFSQFTLPPPRNGMTYNGQWDGSNDIQSGSNLAGLLRTEGLGFNKFYGGYEDSKIRMPSSGNLYGGTYGI